MGKAWGPEFESLDSTDSQTLSCRAVFLIRRWETGKLVSQLA